MWNKIKDFFVDRFFAFCFAIVLGFVLIGHIILFLIIIISTLILALIVPGFVLKRVK